MEMTIDQFEKLLEEAYEIKQDIEKIAAEKKAKEEELNEKNKVILAEFERLDKTSYVSRSCNVIRVNRPSVSMPKVPEAREAFFAYLKERNLFEDMVSVNHNSLNAFFKAELESAIEAGKHDFKIPGLGDPKNFEYITFRKK